MIVEGIIRLKSPLHCAMMGGTEKNLTRTMVQPILTPNGTDYVPYFPGNDIKGRLRRKAARLVIDSLAQKGQKLQPALYAAFTSGSPLGVIENNRTLGETVDARDDAYMGLFGGGGRMLPSRLRVADLMPVIASTVDAKIVPESYAQPGATGFVPTKRSDKDNVSKAVTGYQLLHRYSYTRIDDLIRLQNSSEVHSAIDNPVEAVAKYQSDAVANNIARKNDGDNGPAKMDNSMIYVIEAVAPGTPMYFYAALTPDTSERHAGLFLEALRSLCQEQALGGKSSAGFGRYTADLTIDYNGEKLPVFAQSDDPAQFEINRELEHLTTAAAESIAKATIESIYPFFAPTKVEE